MTASDRSREVLVTATLQPAPRRNHQGGDHALPERLAKQLGRRRKWIEGAIWGPFNYAQTCARLIDALRAAGAVDTLARFAAPIRAALQGHPHVRLTGGLELAAREADATEAVAEKRYDLTHTRESKAALLKALEREIYLRCAERDALREELGL